MLPPVSGRPLVLLVTPDFPPDHGGIQLVAQRLAAHAERYEPHVVTFDGSGAATFDAAQGFAVERVPRAARQPLAIARLNAAAISRARALRPQAVLNLHIVTAPAAWVIGRTQRVAAVQYLHGNEVSARPRLARFAVRSAAVSVAVSSYTRQLALDLGADPARVQVIPPGVDVVAGADGPRASRPTLVTVARMADSLKGHDVMVRALPLIRERVPDVEWLVIGEGPRRAGIERSARDAGLAGCVRFLGALPDVERDAWLERAHVFVMPSRQRDSGGGGEGFGIAYLEAGLHGLPVVAGAVAGALDAVTEETGVLVDPRDERALADAVVALLLDPERAQRLGAAGRERAASFGWPLVARRVETLLLELTGQV